MRLSLYSVGRLVSSIYIEIYENVINGKAFLLKHQKEALQKCI